MLLWKSLERKRKRIKGNYCAAINCSNFTDAILRISQQRDVIGTVLTRFLIRTARHWESRLLFVLLQVKCSPRWSSITHWLWYYVCCGRMHVIFQTVILSISKVTYALQAFAGHAHLCCG